MTSCASIAGGASRITARLIDVRAEDYYGESYQDIQTRVPDLTNARLHLGWEPRVGLRDALERTVAYYAQAGARPAVPAARAAAM